MPKKSTEEWIAELTDTPEGKHKITTIRNALMSGTLESFDQMFATLAKSTLQIVLGISFYAFPKKLEQPGSFTIDEIDFMANLFKVEFDVMISFIRKLQKSKRKTRR